MRKNGNRSALAAALAAVAALGLGACSGGGDGVAPETGARAGVDHLADLAQGSMDAFDCSALSSYDGTYLGDNSKVVDFFRSMPTGADMETFEILGDEGTLVVTYAADATVPDAAVLSGALSALADCGREYVTNLETVRFMVPDGGNVSPQQF